MALAGLAFLLATPVPVEAAAGERCNLDVGWQASYNDCYIAGDVLRAMWASAPAGTSYKVTPICATAPDHAEATCATAQLRCNEPEDTWRYWVWRSISEGPYEPIASTCLGSGEAGSFDVITPGRVLQEMNRLTWPEAMLTIQPPGGRTLVNLETNFFTTTTEPTTQTVTLLGQRVEIEATPVAYTWHFGDGEQQTGADPGAAYPNLRVTHVYVEADVTVHPSVDVTYHGRYRVSGDAWQDIPEELAVDGATANLEVLTATPHLVG